MTAKIKLNAASGGGSFSLQAPSSSSNNRVFTLPDLADATLLTSNATLGKFASYAVISDHKSSGTQSGNFVSGDWRTRDLNTEDLDADGIVSISSNQFTLQAGTYFIKWVCPAYGRSQHQSRLRNITDSTSFTGTSTYADYNSNVQNTSIGAARFTISGAKVYELQHRCGQSATNNGGFGVRVGGDFTTDYEMYAMCEIYKEA